MKIYIVMCSCGEYSDRREWPIISTRNEDIAKQKVVEFTEIVNTNLSYVDSIDDFLEQLEEGLKVANKYPNIYKEKYFSLFNVHRFFIQESELID